MEADQSSGDEADCEPKDSVPGQQSVASADRLPVVSSVADQLIGNSWVAGPQFKVDNFLAGSSAVPSVMYAMAPSASEAALNMSRLIGADYFVRAEADARFKLTDLLVSQVGRISDELHAAPKLTDVWAKPARPIWEGLHVGPGLGVELADEASARAKEIIADLAGLGPDGPLAGAVSPVWEGLQSPAVSELAGSFVPAGPQPAVLSGFTSGIAEKMLAGVNVGSFAGLDLGSPSRFVVGQLSNVMGPAFSGDRWPWSKCTGAGASEGVTAAMHRHVQGLAAWAETTHRAAMDAVWRAPQQSITSMLQSFSVLADQGVSWGWRALWAALRAQEAVLRGDLKTIVRFLREWLGFKRTPHTLVDAASAVLLEEAAWLPAGLAGDDKVVPLIKKLTVREHRNFRLLGDTQLGGRPVDSLDRKIAVSRDEAVRVPLVEVVPAPPPPPAEDDISDPRLLQIMDKLTEREREILWTKAEEGRTWVDAAVSSGATLKDGDNLRRKVKRLSKTAAASAAVEARAAG